MEIPMSGKPSQLNWAWLDACSKKTDSSVAEAQGEEFFANAVLRLPEPKALITIRIDKDVLRWFKSQGPGYQTRMNALLRAYMLAQSTKNHSEKPDRRQLIGSGHGTVSEYD